jgi:Alternative complex III, ActD subunit
MSTILMAEFRQTRALYDAARSARRRGLRLIDAFTPFPVEGLVELMERRPTKVRVFMFLGGVMVAAMAYGGEFYTAVINYPYNSGGRPLNAWPAFMLVPFATGILGASVAGLIRFMLETGLPRLHWDGFGVEGFERASQDRFWLAVEAPEGADARETLDVLRHAGALSVHEVPP